MPSQKRGRIRCHRIATAARWSAREMTRAESSTIGDTRWQPELRCGISPGIKDAVAWSRQMVSMAGRMTWQVLEWHLEADERIVGSSIDFPLATLN